MAVRTKQLFARWEIATTDELIYTVPVGRTIIIKNLTYYNLHSASTNVQFGMYSTANANIFWHQTIASFAIVNLTNLFWVFESEQEIWAKCSAGTFRIWAFGALLDGVAS